MHGVEVRHARVRLCGFRLVPQLLYGRTRRGEVLRADEQIDVTRGTQRRQRIEELGKRDPLEKEGPHAATTQALEHGFHVIEQVLARHPFVRKQIGLIVIGSGDAGCAFRDEPQFQSASGRSRSSCGAARPPDSARHRSHAAVRARREEGRPSGGRARRRSAMPTFALI